MQFTASEKGRIMRQRGLLLSSHLEDADDISFRNKISFAHPYLVPYPNYTDRSTLDFDHVLILGPEHSKDYMGVFSIAKGVIATSGGLYYNSLNMEYITSLDKAYTVREWCFLLDVRKTVCEYLTPMKLTNLDYQEMEHNLRRAAEDKRYTALLMTAISQK